MMAHLIRLPLTLLALFSLLSAVHSGTWLSFNQNTGGLELADRLFGGQFHGKSIADVLASGELDPEKDAQLAGLVRMCQDRVKRSSGSRGVERLDDLCSALLQVSKDQQRRKRKLVSRFVPVRMDEDLLWL